MDEKNTTVGNILAGVIVVASLIVGYLTKDVIFDTVICALTFGNFLRNIGILVLLTKIAKRDYYQYDQFALCDNSIKEKRVGIYDEMIKRAHRITLSFGFFELYFPFLLTIIIPNTICKIIAPLIFIAALTTIKVICNPVKSSKSKRIFHFWLRYKPTYVVGLQPKPKSSRLARLFRKDLRFSGFYIYGKNYYKILIVIRAILFSAPFYGAGLLLSSQTWFPIGVYDDLKIVIPVLMVGIFNNIWRDYKVFDAYWQGKKTLPFEFVNQMVANYFGIKTWDDVYEQREIEENERKREEAEKERLEKERRVRIAYMWLDAECRRIEEWKEEKRKKEEKERKREEEERLKKAQRKLDQGKISEISQEDLDKLMKLEAEKFKVQIRESSRTSRTSVNRKIE